MRGERRLGTMGLAVSVWWFTRLPSNYTSSKRPSTEAERAPVAAASETVELAWAGPIERRVLLAGRRGPVLQCFDEKHENAYMRMPADEQAPSADGLVPLGAAGSSLLAG